MRRVVAAMRSRLLVITGAGLSAASGIPTFRGADGYWRQRDPRTLATFEAFDRDPELVWEWYRERRAGIRRALPNAGHRALVELAGRRGENFLLVSQNVDDLDARAGMPADRMVHVHGDIFVSRCERCDFTRRDEGDDEPGVPRCPECGLRLRPGVVWFNEMLDQSDVARVNRFLEPRVETTCLVVGTTATFGYLVEWALAARASGGELIEINPDPSPLSRYASHVIRESAAEVLPRLT